MAWVLPGSPLGPCGEGLGKLFLACAGGAAPGLPGRPTRQPRMPGIRPGALFGLPQGT